MTTQPLLFSYIRLGDLVDQGGTSAFARLLDLPKNYPGSAVVVPTLEHFATLPALQQAMRELIERETGARVLVLPESTIGIAA